MHKVDHIAERIKLYLFSPMVILFFCSIFFICSVVLNGNLFRVWSLNRDLTQLQEKTLTTKAQIKQIEINIQKTKDPTFLERQAREKLDLVNENDLIFIFSE